MSDYNKLEKVLEGRTSFLEDLVRQKKRPFELVLLVGASTESVARLTHQRVSDLLINWTSYREKWDFVSIPDIFRAVAKARVNGKLENFTPIANKLKKLGGWFKDMKGTKKERTEEWSEPFVGLFKIEELVKGTEYEWITRYRLNNIFFEAYRNGTIHELVPERVIINSGFFEETEPYLALDVYETEWGIYWLHDFDMEEILGVSFPAKFLVKTLKEVFANLIDFLQDSYEKGEIHLGYLEFLDLSLGYWEIDRC